MRSDEKYLNNSLECEKWTAGVSVPCLAQGRKVQSRALQEAALFSIVIKALEESVCSEAAKQVTRSRKYKR